MPESAPELVWEALGRPVPEGKTGSGYRFEAVAPAEGGGSARCATCGVPIGTGVPVRPRRGVKGIDNPTFFGHAEYFRYGSHVCPACAFFYGDPKRTHRSVAAIGDRGFWPVFSAKSATAERPRWRQVLGMIARVPAATPLAGVLTTDPKIRLWPRMELGTAARPALYVHAPDYDWSRSTAFDLRRTAEAMALVDRGLALGAPRAALWAGLVGAAKVADRHGVGAVLALEAAIAPWRGSPELVVALLAA